MILKTSPSDEEYEEFDFDNESHMARLDKAYNRDPDEPGARIPVEIEFIDGKMMIRKF